MKKTILLISIISVSLLLVVAVVAILVRKSQEPVVSSASDSQIESLTTSWLSSVNPDLKGERLKTSKYITFMGSWVIADITMVDEPDDSEIKTIRCIFDDQSSKLSLMGCSSHGFIREGDLENVPDILIERANQPL